MDEGMGRPTEAWEERIEGVPIMPDRTIRWPYEAEIEVEPNIPLNAGDLVISRMRDMSNEQLTRVIIAAGILWWETSEDVWMRECLYTATQMERYRDGGP
jgi:hypothetical protein